MVRSRKSSTNELKSSPPITEAQERTDAEPEAQWDTPSDSAIEPTRGTRPVADEYPLDLYVRRRIETNLKVTFFFTLAVGLLGASFGDWIIPSVSVLTYAVIGWMLTRRESNIERFADSLYYMGFLLTIWGLLFAFSPLAGDVANLSSKTIITQFGIKLITTVIALTARILILQARGTLAEQTDEAHDTLAATAIRMTGEIEQSVHAFKQMRNDLVSQATSGITGIQTEAIRILHASSEAYLRDMTESLGRVNSSTANLVNRLNAIEVPGDVIATQLNQGAKVVSAEVENLRRSLHGSTDALSLELKEALSKIVQAGEQASSAVNGLSALQRLATEAQKAQQTIAATHTTYQESLGRTTELVKEFAASVTQLRDASRSDINQLRSSIEQSATAIKSEGASISQNARQFSEALTQSVRLLRMEIERK